MDSYEKKVIAGLKNVSTESRGKAFITSFFVVLILLHVDPARHKANRLGSPTKNPCCGDTASGVFLFSDAHRHTF